MEMANNKPEQSTESKALSQETGIPKVLRNVAWVVGLLIVAMGGEIGKDIGRKLSGVVIRNVERTKRSPEGCDPFLTRKGRVFLSEFEPACV